MTDEVAVKRDMMLWNYHKSHSMLWLMSPKSPEQSTRYSIVFKSVANICLPVNFYLRSFVQSPHKPWNSLFKFDGWETISSNEAKGFVRDPSEFSRAQSLFVVAGSVFQYEDDHEFNVPVPLFDFGVKH